MTKSNTRSELLASLLAARDLLPRRLRVEFGPGVLEAGRRRLIGRRGLALQALDGGGIVLERVIQPPRPSQAKASLTRATQRLDAAHEAWLDAEGITARVAAQHSLAAAETACEAALLRMRRAGL